MVWGKENPWKITGEWGVDGWMVWRFWPVELHKNVFEFIKQGQPYEGIVSWSKDEGLLLSSSRLFEVHLNPLQTSARSS